MSAEIKNLGAKKEPREAGVIQQEYQNLAFRAGNLQYEIACKQGDLELLNKTMRDLNFEFVESKNKADAAKAEADKKAAEEAAKPSLEAVPAPESEAKNA